MPNQRVSMRQIRAVLRRHEQGLSHRQIGRICGRSRNIVHSSLTRLAAVGLRWPLPADQGEVDLERRI